MNDGRAQTQEWYAAKFAQFEKGLNGGTSTALHGLRRASMAKFAATGFPTTSHEEWRFTNLAPLARTEFIPALAGDDAGVTHADLEGSLLGEGAAADVVFVDGQWSTNLSALPSLPPGIRVVSLAQALRQKPDEVMAYLSRHVISDGTLPAALNTAFLHDGAFVLLEDGTALDRPIHLLFVASARPVPFMTAPRIVIVAGKEARVTIVESYVSLANNVYWTNAVTDVFAGAGAVVEHDTLQIESPSAFHTGATHFQLGKGSVVASNAIVLGGLLVRNTVSAVFEGEDGECTLNGLAVASGAQLVDNHTIIDHAKPKCTSHELYKSILDGKARGVFNGKIFVRQDAQKTDAKQTNRTLLLSDEATIDTKPQLEIFADDVKCTHGAAVGRLNDEQVFYLRSRGLDEAAARDLLTFAFAGDIIRRIHVAPLRDRLTTFFRTRLQQGRVASEDLCIP